MKILKSMTFFGILLCAPFSNGQGTFQNLNFEEANPVSDGLFTVSATSAFPYWSVYSGSVQLTSVTYNDPALGTTTVSLVGPNSPIFPGIDGNYSALLQGGVTASAASISQTGVIPSGTESLYFEAQGGAGPLELFIGSQSVSFSAVGTGANYTLYAADVSPWAGATEELAFSAPIDGGRNNWILDDISFSPNAVPEPSPLILAGAGGLLLTLYRRFASKRR